jgi:hypothetical protein
VNFGVLALIVLAGLAGPLLGAGRNAFVPVLIGEILAGVVVGRSGLDAVDASDPTVQFLSDVGFAMSMFTVGAHLPLRDPRLPASLRSGSVATGAVLLLAPLAGVAAAWFAATGDAAIYAVILGSGSAAAVVTMITEARLTGSDALTVIGQVTTVDVTILAIPLVLRPDRIANVALGGAVVAAVYVLAHRIYSRGWCTASAGNRSSAGGRSICACPCWSCSRCRGSPRRAGPAYSSQASALACSWPPLVAPSDCSRRCAVLRTDSSSPSSSSSSAPDCSSAR